MERKTIPLLCTFCKTEYLSLKSSVKKHQMGLFKNNFCSNQCSCNFAKSNRPISKCQQCSILFQKPLSLSSRCKGTFCSKKCFDISRFGAFVKCHTCNKEVYKNRYAINRSDTGRYFCSVSCNSKYNSVHKTHCYNVSKLEKLIQKYLLNKYQIKFDFNQCNTIGSELDIYIPSLKIAFELNGITHYKPIYGEDKLKYTKKNDRKKKKKCKELNIRLIVIDIRKCGCLRSNTEKHIKPYIDIIDKEIGSHVS